MATISIYVSRPVSLKRRDAVLEDLDFEPRTILVTGVNMTKGLTLARALHEAGHTIIGADFESFGCGRVSKAISAFRILRKPDPKSPEQPYIESLLKIVENDEVDLWISCSGVVTEVDDGEAKQIVEARTHCKAIQFTASTMEMLHDKQTFIQKVHEAGLNIPDTHRCTSHRAIEEVLASAPVGRNFILKPIDVDDANRGDMTLLPNKTATATTEHLTTLNISEKSPWVLQQFIDGPEYCTHALVVKQQVTAFVACPSAELLMHYEALPINSKLWRAMLKFTQEFANKQQVDFTGQLSFDFMIERSSLLADEDEPVLFPIECNPRAHTAIVLFEGTPELTDAYLSVLDGSPDPPNLSMNIDPIVPKFAYKYYWIGHDLVESLLQPLFRLLLSPSATHLRDLVDQWLTFAKHVIYWHDGTFRRWDPVPWWWLYHIYWPMRFWHALRHGMKWSRVNVSTGKMFES